MPKDKPSAMLKHKISEQGEFAYALELEIAKKGWDLVQTAVALGMSYEHTRKMVKSLTFPSRLLQAKVCEVFKLDPKAVDRMVVHDKLKHKFGTIPADLAGTHPKYPHVERQLGRMTDQQVQMAVAMIDGIVRSNSAK